MKRKLSTLIALPFILATSLSVAAISPIQPKTSLMVDSTGLQKNGNDIELFAETKDFLNGEDASLAMAKKIINDGFKYYQEGNFEDGVKAFNKIENFKEVDLIKFYIVLIDLNNVMAFEKQDARYQKEAIKYAEKLVAKQPTAENLYLLGSLYVDPSFKSTQDLNKAIKNFREAASLEHAKSAIAVSSVLAAKDVKEGFKYLEDYYKNGKNLNPQDKLMVLQEMVGLVASNPNLDLDPSYLPILKANMDSIKGADLYLAVEALKGRNTQEALKLFGQAASKTDNPPEVKRVARNALIELFMKTDAKDPEFQKMQTQAYNYAQLDGGINREQMVRVKDTQSFKNMKKLDDSIEDLYNPKSPKHKELVALLEKEVELDNWEAISVWADLVLRSIIPGDPDKAMIKLMEVNLNGNYRNYGGFVDLLVYEGAPQSYLNAAGMVVDIRSRSTTSPLNQDQIIQNYLYTANILAFSEDKQSNEQALKLYNDVLNSKDLPIVNSLSKEKREKLNQYLTIMKEYTEAEIKRKK